MGVRAIKAAQHKGDLAGALVVREHEELIFISQNGMVQRTGVRGINRYGRAAQGVKVMNLREGDEVSAVALVVETAADANGNGNGADEAEGVLAIEPDEPSVGSDDTSVE